VYWREVYALRIREAIDPLPLGEEGFYVPDKDASVEAKLADGCTCSTHMLVRCNGRNCWRCLIGIACQGIRYHV